MHEALCKKLLVVARYPMPSDVALSGDSLSFDAHKAGTTLLVNEISGAYITRLMRKATCEKLLMVMRHASSRVAALSRISSSFDAPEAGTTLPVDEFFKAYFLALKTAYTDSL